MPGFPPEHEHLRFIPATTAFQLPVNKNCFNEQTCVGLMSEAQFERVTSLARLNNVNTEQLEILASKSWQERYFQFLQNQAARMQRNFNQHQQPTRSYNQQSTRELHEIEPVGSSDESPRPKKKVALSASPLLLNNKHTNDTTVIEIVPSDNEEPKRVDSPTSNTNNRKCEEHNCKTTRHFGYPGGRASHCNLHKKEGMVNLSQKRCRECRRTASYGFEKDKLKLFCAGHKKDGTVNLTIRKCFGPACNKTANYGYKGEPLQYCTQHKLKNMKLRRAWKDTPIDHNSDDETDIQRKLSPTMTKSDGMEESVEGEKGSNHSAFNCLGSGRTFTTFLRELWEQQQAAQVNFKSMPLKLLSADSVLASILPQQSELPL